MPIYDYFCDCGKTWEDIRSVKNRNSMVCECGHLAKIAISIPARPVIHEYYSENLNAQITGPAQKKRVMKAKGMEESG